MVNLDSLRKKYEQVQSGGRQNSEDFLKKFFMMDEGTSVVRILPGSENGDEFYAETAIHRINDRNHHCPRVQDKDCPICETYLKLWKTPLDSDKDVARQIKARRRYYLNVVDRRDEGVKILSVGQKLFGKILDAFFDEDYGDLTDTKEGWDFKIVKDTQGQWPNYDKSAPKPKSSEAGTDSQVATWMDETHDIHNLVKLPEYEDLKKLALEIESITGLAAVPERQYTEESSSDSDEDYLSHLKDLKG